MKRGLLIYIVILTILTLLTSNCMAKGYKIIVEGVTDRDCQYRLSSYYWGKKIAIDSVKLKNNRVIFSNNNRELPFGEYIIERVNNKTKERVTSFVISTKKGYKTTLYIDTLNNTTTLKKGDLESKYYIDFNNFSYNLLTLTSIDKLEDTLSKYTSNLKLKVNREIPNSITSIMVNNSYPKHKTVEDFIKTFPISNNIILYTSYGKGMLESLFKLIMYNKNPLIKKELEKIFEPINTIQLELKSNIIFSAYNFFKESKIMGQDEVAIWIAENYILNNRVPLPQEYRDEFFTIKSFVEFNKRTLIGCVAPELNLTEINGNYYPLYNCSGDYTILFFYSTDCNNCLIEGEALVNYLNEYKNGMLSVYAVCTNNNKENIQDFIDKHFLLYNPFINWVNVYDPNMESNFPLLYGVISTPKMFVLDRYKTIVARNLNVKTLNTFLELKNREKEQTTNAISKIFNPIADDLDEIKREIDRFYNRAIDTEGIFNTIFIELFEFMAQSQYYNLNLGAEYLGNEYILNKEELWREDLIFYNSVKEALDRFSINKLGTICNDIELEDISGAPLLLHNINNKYKILYFYRDNCHSCTAITPLIYNIYNNFKKKIDIEVVAINIGTNKESWKSEVAKKGYNWINCRPENLDSLYNNYAMKEIPAIYLLKDNIVIAKEISDIELKEILENL